MAKGNIAPILDSVNGAGMSTETQRLSPILDGINAAHEKGDMDEMARLVKEYAHLATIASRLDDLNASHAKGNVTFAAYWARELAKILGVGDDESQNAGGGDA